MDSMRVGQFLQALDEFREKLIEHRKLWGDSLSQPIPSYPVRNTDELEKQSQWLTRRLGALRPYLDRFDNQWIMHHQATGSTWDGLDASVGLSAVSQIKGPSLRATVEKLNTIAGRLEAMDQDDIIPADRAVPMKSGMPADRIVLAYLSHLHPYIAKGCTKLFVDEHYAQAVEESAKAVFQYLREASGLTLDGATLGQQAFSLKAPILAFSDLSDETKRNEQLGFMEMLAAYAKGVRNPLAHTHGKLEEAQKAFEYLCMASLFCRRIDDASPKVSAAATTP
ncbi:TIGR02391 family protein [Ralstonia pseudosolanacearum]|uniref:TIGR02391 family protein n=1 Tax=Ralstonia pseudosolanacearum TaxID=1310165 RepID=UPI00270AC47D|nr:TIGR02391 family protein [Ralstonia pseudosolanacearum]MDO3617124.1 TIGR02391 family protein [Ralstonia pseudosolanacearum]